MGLGTWQLLNDTTDTIEAALEMGYRMIDTSGDYGTQPGIGEAISRSPLPREALYIVTKVEEDEDSFDATKQNLAELGLEYADLILIHRPPKNGSGVGLWEGLIQARKEGLTRDIGVSNYSATQIQELIEETDEVPVVNQIEWSPFGHSEGMYAFAKDNGIVIQAYSPLTRAQRLDDPTLSSLADKYKKTPAQILIRWNLERETVPLPKANTREHLTENLDVFDFELQEEDIEALSGLNEHYSALSSLPYVE